MPVLEMKVKGGGTELRATYDSSDDPPDLSSHRSLVEGAVGPGRYELTGSICERERKA
jgi:hypothetical protein